MGSIVLDFTSAVLGGTASGAIPSEPSPAANLSPMVANDWIEHRRGDGERVGRIIPRGDDFVVVDLLGRERGGPVDWLGAEEALDALGIGYLADIYVLTLENG